MNAPTRILILDDNEVDRELIKRELVKSGLDLTFNMTKDKATFIQALDKFTPDIVLSDFAIPSFDGMAALALARQRFEDIPVIIISGVMGEEFAIETIKAGATNYVLKQRLDRLPMVVVQALEDAKRERECKQIEKEFEEYKNSFISKVSHELRTPLTIIKEGLGIVLDRTAGPINEEQEGFLKMAKGNIDRLTRLINSILDLSKIDEGRLKLRPMLVNLNNLIQETCNKWKLVTDKHSQLFDFYLPNQSISTMVDRDVMIEIIDNLISNAVKFTPAQGKIIVTLKDSEGQIEISVADSGIGIDAEDLPKVFSRFHQFSRLPLAGNKGTGLGLSIVKELVGLHNGEIRAESEPGQGTKFIITIPKITGTDE